MQITDLLAQTGGLQSVARELGVSEAEVTTGANVLLPALLGGFKRQAQAQPAGLDGLGTLLGQLGGTGLFDQVLGPQPSDVSAGNSILGQIFGSKDVSRAVAHDAAAHSGLAPSLLKKMLPLLAMLVTGYLARQRSAAAHAAPQASSGGALGGMPDGLLDGQRSHTDSPGLASLLDMDGNGNPLDDVIRMAGKAFR